MDSPSSFSESGSRRVNEGMFAVRDGNVLVCWWPGLAAVAGPAVLVGLAEALAFACLLNFSIVITLVWTELFDPLLQWGCWGIVALWWTGSIARTRWFSMHAQKERAATQDDKYRDALRSYLQGEWIAAENQLRELLKRQPQDAEAMLLLVSLLRRSRREPEAVELLERLKRLDGAGKWKHEMATEEKHLAAILNK